MKIKLTKNISDGKGKFYGLEGQEVELVTDSHWPVLIVELKGNRFSTDVKNTDYETE